jgi:hypothetical protein
MIWLSIALALAGGAAIGWRAKGWWCSRENPSCPVWRVEAGLTWKAVLRKRYPNGSRERHPTPVDLQGGSGVPSTNTNGVETKPANPKRRTTP